MALAGREKSMSFVWFILASIVVVVTLIFVYDEVVGRRTWKKYAAEWEALEEKRINTAMVEAKKEIDQKKLKEIQLQKEKATLVLESDEFEKAKEDEKKKSIALDKANQNLQFAKADLDEIFYRWKHAEHEKHPFEQYKKEYEALEKKIADLQKIQEKAELEANDASAKVKGMQDKLAELEAEEAKILSKVNALEKQLKAVKERGSPIEQYVLDDIGIAGSTQWGTVDRCTTCHIPTLKAGYENQKNPFKTHPHYKEIFEHHPVEDFGCVSCHGGQGRATQIKHQPLQEGDFVHGFEHHWKNPLLRGDFVQSSCNKCHVQQLNLDMAPVYTQGKHLFVELGCVGCHKIKGMEWAPKAGPSLSKIKDKVYPEWMLAWIRKPTSYLPATRMPQPPWKNDQEIIQVMSYILAQSEPFNWKYGKFSGGNAESGKEIFNKVGCFACHNVDERGGTAGPSLNRIAEKTSADWIYNWIQEPKNWSHTARMPSLRLTQQEASDITAYLITHGQQPQPDAALRTALLDEKNIQEGFRVINTYGCYACHDIKGFEKASNPSVELTDFGRKPESKLAFGDAHIPETWEAWTDLKLKNPQAFLDERSTSYMPKPNATDEERHALVVFLKGQRPEVLPQKYIAYDPEIEAGRHLINQYNCKSCHVIEGEGQEVAKWIKEPNFLPPNLATAGARLQTPWLTGFLKNPGDYPKVRSWLDIRMPTFGFTDAETDSLVKYFKRSSGVDTLFETIHTSITSEQKEAAEQLISANNFNCASCHIIGNNFPAGGPTVWAPDLAYVAKRIRPQWINPWVRNPPEMIPGIRMPGYYPEKGTGPKDILGGDDEKQIQALVNYLMWLGNPTPVIPVTATPTPETAPSSTPETAPTSAGIGR